MTFEKAVPPSVGELLGRPEHPECVLVPVSGVRESIALVYADNGEADRPLRGVDLLEVAASQIGLVFENEMLRSQLKKAVETNG